MIDPRIAELARRHGVAAFEDEDGTPVVPDYARMLSALGVDVGSDAAIAAGLEATVGLKPPVLRAPPGARCYLPDWLDAGRAWGISVQLYELRSARNWGIGDFADLAAVGRIAANAGADFIGVNPLHALFLSAPDRCSPFSPSNRLFLNPLYIAIDHLPFHVASADDAEVARSLRAEEAIDYAGVTQLKIAALRRHFGLWTSDPAQEPPFSHAAFRSFRESGGSALREHALFEVLSARMMSDGHGSGWRDWPAQYRDVASAAVRQFAASHQDDIRFHTWLQWIAHVQLAEAGEAARAAGMRIGIYLDFAVGEAPDGSGSWGEPELLVPGMNIGAPPDMFTVDGQDWGLAPLSPLAMQRSGFAGFRRTNDALMRHAGALRIDHAMALWQLFFVPSGGPPADGAYVRYPVERLLGILAEQSRAHRAIVIGEDLGHVPPGFRDVMEEVGILSYRIVYFEKQDESFNGAASYPKLALACLSTHDMPTLNGWWRGEDIDLRLEHGLIHASDADAQRLERARDRAGLVALFLDEQVLDPADVPGPHERSDMPAALVVAAHRFVARTPSLLTAARLADLVSERRQTNLPGTVDSYPNWRLKSATAIEDLEDAGLFNAITGAIAAERPRS